MRWRGIRVGVGILAVSTSVWAFGVPWNYAPHGWNRAPKVTVIGSASDPRVALVHEAVDFWNARFVELGTPFRLGPIERVDGEVDVSDLQAMTQVSSTNLLRGAWLREHPEPFARYPGDLLVVLSEGSFISFSSRIGDRRLVAIKSGKLGPLTKPNVLRNVIAHELGHAIGLPHDDDPALLMCGRPAPCRPDLFASETPRFFPLNQAERDRLRHWYPSSWGH